ncbi:hypothetical protein Tco_0368664 [Tanacetum coccineum]
MPSVEPAPTVPYAMVPSSENAGCRGTASAKETLEPILQNRSEFVHVTKKSSPSAIVGNVKQTPALKLSQGLGKSKIQTRPNMPLRRPNTLYPKSDYHQVGWNYSSQPGYEFQPPNFGSLGPYPPYPYMNQPNVIIEQLVKVREKNVFWSINKEVQERLLNLTSIRRIILDRYAVYQDLDEFNTIA